MNILLSTYASITLSKGSSVFQRAAYSVGVISDGWVSQRILTSILGVTSSVAFVTSR